VYRLGLLLTAATVLASADFNGTVVHVADGDTLTVLNAGHPVRVRLFGIDAPERQQAGGARRR
jgi:endonuclease YncB( thermonuclease family)